jgi:uridylate kinase
MNKETIVISLGGSLIVPDRVDAEYVKNFVSLVKEKTGHGIRFAIVTGGGKIAREYRDALANLGVNDAATLDWMGIVATRYNAELLRYSFGELAEPAIFLDPTSLMLSDKPILVGGGWKPGHSSDGSAVALAKTLGAKKLINLSNIDYVYDADPKKNPDAKKLEKISWNEYLKLVPKDWDPGLNSPFDPVASRLAQEAGIEVVIMNGANLAELSNYIEAQPFIGTVIKD